jgi:hypothetical protein
MTSPTSSSRKWITGSLHDGLSVEFYQKFWVHLVDDLHQSISHGIEKGSLSDSQQREVIRLIAKKGKDPN